MTKYPLAAALVLALTACGGGGSEDTAIGDGVPVSQPPSSGGVPPAASAPRATPSPGQTPTSGPVAGRPAPDPEPVVEAPPVAEQPPQTGENPPPVATPAPPAAPRPSPVPVATPTSGSWVVVCRQSHDRAGIVMGVVTTAGLFSVDDGTVDLTGQPASQQRLVQADAYNPEVSSQIQYTYGNQTLVLGVGDDTRPRWVGAYEVGERPRQWECSVVLQNIAPAQQAMCYASKEPLAKGLGPPVIVGFDWMDSRVFVNRSDAPSVRYSLGQARDVTLPYEGRASDGTNLQCW